MNRENDPLPMYFLSGLAADETIFCHQKRVFPQLHVLPWLRPRTTETLSEYSSRIAELIPPQTPCIVGGASFGGIVAMELAKYVDAQACVLLGSIQSRKQMPLRIRALKPFRALLKFVPLSLVKFQARLGSWVLAKIGVKHLALLLDQVAKSDAETMRWSLQQILLWDRDSQSIPIWQIHGSRDWVFPVCLVRPDEIVSGAGHVLSLTHADQVNRFLKANLQRGESEPTI